MTAHRWFRMLPIAAAALVLAAAAVPAQAAPQILALVETPAPLPMNCDGGTCTAELSAMCLQKERVAPQPGTAYRAADPDHVRVVLVASDGTRRELGAETMTFRSVRSYSSVEVSVPAAGAVRAELSVGRVAAVVPAPTADDANPVTQAEVDRATGLRRMAALRAERIDAPLVTAARAANRLVNGAAEEWLAMARDLGVALDDPGLVRAQEMAAACRRYVDHRGEDGFAGCLRFRHDWLMQRVNDTYYRRTDVGS